MRLFIALELPGEVASELARWARHALAAREGVRRLPVESLHATLAFLGERDAGEIPLVAQAMADVSRPLGAVELGPPLWLPPRNSRSLAVELHDDADSSLHELHDALGRELGRAIGFEPERRRFRPHVTVARLRGGAARRLQRELPPTPQLGFTPHALTLYRSELLPEGALYTALAASEL